MTFVSFPDYEGFMTKAEICKKGQRFTESNLSHAQPSKPGAPSWYSGWSCASHLVKKYHLTFYNKNILIILLIFCIGPTVIMCYLRRFSSFGLFISSNMVVYRFRECEKKIKWENLYIETILETNLPYPRKKFYFRDLKNPTNDFKYEMNQPTRKKFIKMLTKYFPANHEIFKKV